MGWGRTLLLGDVGNRLDIADVEQEIDTLQNEIENAYRGHLEQDERLRLLERENAELKLYLATALRLLVAKNVVTPEELERMVLAIDAEDGEIDGGHSGPIA